MSRFWALAACVAALAGAVAAQAAAPVSPVRLLKLESVTLSIRNRVFPEFHELEKARMKVEFAVGASDYTARVVEFVPDFTLNDKTHKVTSRSNEPRNPAVRIIVKEKGVPQDTSWAFLNFPPHFSRRSILSFQIARLDFVDRAPLISSDSTVTQGATP